MSDLISVYFEDDDGNKISFDNTYLAERTIGSPEPQTYTVEIPGKDGLLDLTESLDGYIHYNNREVELLFKFIDTTGDVDRDAFYASVYKQVHGKKLKVWFSDYGQEDFYLYGRCSVEEVEFTHDNPWGFYFTVTMDCEPWWYDAEETEIECDLTSWSLKAIRLSDVWDTVNSKDNNVFTFSCGTADGESEPCKPYAYMRFYYANTVSTFTTLELWDTDGNHLHYWPDDDSGFDYDTTDGYWYIEPDDDGYADVTCNGASSIDVTTKAGSAGDEIVYSKIFKIKLTARRKETIASHYLTAWIKTCASVSVDGADNHPTPQIWCPLNHTLVSNGREWWELTDGWNTCDGLTIPESDDDVTLYFTEGEDMEGEGFDGLDDDESDAVIVYRGGRL